MHPSLLAGSAAVLVALYWLLSRRRPSLTAAIDTRAIAALNQAQIALVSGSDLSQGLVNDQVPIQVNVVPLPSTPRQQADFLRGLVAQLAGDGPQRLAAIEAARRWGVRTTLPLLHRGLRDVDPTVVRAAALAMERFRGRSSGAQAAQALPRNVARTR